MREKRTRSVGPWALRLLAAQCLAAASGILDPNDSRSADRPPAAPSAATGQSDRQANRAAGIAVLCHFADGHSQRIDVTRKSVAITTPYARLQIPIEDIRTIELSPRLPEAVGKRVREAIARLESPDARERSAATAELFNLREKSYLALVRASKSNHPDLAKAAGELVADLRPLVPRELFAAAIWDVIETDSSRFAGEIDLSQLGAGEFRLAEVEINRPDRQVAEWVLANGGMVWVGNRQIHRGNRLPLGDFRIERIYLHDRTAPMSVNGPWVQGAGRIEFNRDDIDRLASLSALTNLEFSSALVTDDVLRRLSKLTSLQRVILCGAHITDAGLHAFAGMKRLNRLDLSETNISDEGLVDIAEVKSLTNSAFTDEQRKWQEQPHPPDLFLNGTRTTEAALARLQEALPDCQISASHVFKNQAIMGLLPLPPRPGAPDSVWAGWLLGYRIGDCQLFTAAQPETGVRHTNELRGPVQIVKLIFNDPKSREWSLPLEELMLRRLADLPHLSELRLGEVSPDALSGLRAFKHLKSLEFNKTSCVNDAELRDLVSLPELTRLSCTGVPLTGSGLPNLADLPKLKQVSLVECPQLRSTNLEALAKVEALTNLSLRGSPIDDSAVPSLAQLTKLQVLDLSNTRVTPSGLAQLAATLPKCIITGPKVQPSH
jgi:internalin A